MPIDHGFNPTWNPKDRAILKRHNQPETQHSKDYRNWRNKRQQIIKRLLYWQLVMEGELTPTGPKETPLPQATVDEIRAMAPAMWKQLQEELELHDEFRRGVFQRRYPKPQREV
jgi:hypothetical protein